MLRLSTLTLGLAALKWMCGCQHPHETHEEEATSFPESPTGLPVEVAGE